MLALALLLLACQPDPPKGAGIAQDSTPPTSLPTGTTTVPALGPTNVLFVLMDDVGNDKVGTYGEHPTAPPLPTLDRLAEEGVLFRNAYTNPICGPTRAALLTGRHTIRYGGGENYQQGFLGGISLNERMIPEMLDGADPPWNHAVVGKWHLIHELSEGAATHPLDSGFQHHHGSISNLLATLDPANQPASYTHWEYLDDGQTSLVEEYAVSFLMDRASERIEAMPEPWFLYLPVHAAHHPWEAPPAALLDAPLADDADQIAIYHAMLQALDRELGRLLDGMDPDVLARTTVVVMGDNGAPGAMIQPPLVPGQGKLTLYEAGINVPLIVRSPLVVEPGREVGELVSIVDWFPTIAEIAGVDVTTLTRDDGSPAPLDGLSLLPLLTDPSATLDREAVFVERFGPPGPPPYSTVHRAVVERDWKYAWVRGDDADVEGLYDLRGRTDDGPNLMSSPLDAEATAALTRLQVRLATFEATPYEGE